MRIIVRNRHHKDAIRKGTPQFFKRIAGKVRFCIGNKVRICKLLTILYLSSPEYHAATGTITRIANERIALEYEGFNREGKKPEWFYIMCFKMADLLKSYAGRPQDDLPSEIVERWLETCSS